METLIICLTVLLALLILLLWLNPASRDFVIRHFIGIASVIGSMLMVVQSKLESTPHFGRREAVETIVESLIAGCTTVAAYKSIPGSGSLAKLKAAPPPLPSP